jgi:hypothetical protein
MSVSMPIGRRSLVVGIAALAVALTASRAHAEGPTVTPVPGVPLLRLSAFDLAPFGYSTEEFFISGTATSYKVDGTPTADGKWSAVPAGTAPYSTRIVVVRPTDPRQFNGTVIVEWLNVTAGNDAAPDWNTAHREILRSGYAYVGVSAQSVGIEGAARQGGMSFGTALKQQNPERYGSLNHPGDRYSFDIYSQAGRVVRANATTRILGSLMPKRVLATGESQSAVFMTTYINAIDPVVKVYDGFLVHSRFGSSASLEAGGMGAGPNGPQFVKFRPDLRVPVIAVETETDMVTGNIPGYHGARTADYDKLRVWEVPGTAHGDNYSFTVGAMDSGTLPIEKLAALWAPLTDLPVPGGKLAKAVNNAPQHHYVVQAALVGLDHWVGTGKAPAKAEPMKLKFGVDDAPPTFVTDANGLTEGGVRTPWVDAPTARLSGVGNSGNALAFLVGSCEPFDTETLDRLYPGGKRQYLKKFETSLDSAIKSGFILAADKKEILSLADISYRGSH